MAERKDDRRLGMNQPITRRDFLDGVALATGAAVFGGTVASAIGQTHPYLPGLTRLRGQTDTDFTAMHAIRDQDFWAKAGNTDADRRAL